MKTINIKGKEYVTVNERLKEFRNTHKDYSLTTEIIELGADYCTMKAVVTDPNGIVRATGFAREVVAKSPINKYAFVENCETSAIGRALGNFGIGIDDAVCTADELIMKLSQEQGSTAPQRSDFEKDATSQKRAFNKAVKDKAESAPAQQMSLDESAKKCLEWLNSLTAEQFATKANSAKDRAHDIRDACLSASVPELTDIGLKIAKKLKEFEPDIDDNIPY